jgi:hypothetical protein
MATDVVRRLPPRLLCILYVALAHVSLALAFAAVAIDPPGPAVFFYHSRFLAIVHLVTLGWITASILGALYIVGPTALRTWFPARWPDYLAAAFVWIGIVGMVAHFWIQEYGGMAWSGAMVGAGIIAVGIRIARPLRHAPIPAAVRVHVGLGFVNVAAAAVLGVLLGAHIAHPFLPGSVLNNVFAHAHLAAIGWAALMVVGIGYRLLPMVLPSRMPSGPLLWVTAALLQIGVTGLFVMLLFRASLAWVFAGIVTAGFAVFLGQVIWMVRHLLPRPSARIAIERHAILSPVVLHVAAAFSSLAIACGLGLWLSIEEPSERMLQLAVAYGVFGLVGFLAQMVVAMQARLLPIFAWYWASTNVDGAYAGPAPHEMHWHTGHQVVAVLWFVGVPTLAAGLAFDALPVVRAAGISLLAATVIDSAQAAIILRHAYTLKPSPAAVVRTAH